MKRLLVVANETVCGQTLIEAVQKHAEQDAVNVTVVCPVNQPREGYVVYEDTRRAAAGRRLEWSLRKLRDAGVPAHGFVVDAGPVDAVRDELAQSEYDAVIVSTHPQKQSGWLRRNVVDRIRSAAGDVPVEHVVVDVRTEGEGEANVLVIANETVLGKHLLQRIRERASESRASFLIISPQSDPTEGAHPDPFNAAIEAMREERVDEIIVSTFGPERSGWLRRDLVERLRNETKVPVEHIVFDREAVAT